MDKNIVEHDPVYAAITKAVHAAIAAVGGIDGLKKTSMFPSSNARAESLKKAA
ncbi:MAG: hypothetical protein ACT6Q5_08590 [Sphingopyxis solisilvae]|uniref:hypothetical protein n=1 Tax=Sphingopyxis solisilvae TaxID=1886788 RepID=UPI004036D611